MVRRRCRAARAVLPLLDDRVGHLDLDPPVERLRVRRAYARCTTGSNVEQPCTRRMSGDTFASSGNPPPPAPGGSTGPSAAAASTPSLKSSSDVWPFTNTIWRCPRILSAIWSRSRVASGVSVALPGVEQQPPADAGLLAVADLGDFRVGALGALALDLRLPALARAHVRAELLELAHAGSRCRPGRCSSGSGTYPNASRIAASTLIISSLGLLLVLGLRPGLEHPQDHEQPHHAHDEIGQREDPLRALFTDLVGVALFAGCSHGVAESVVSSQ